jgi:DNA-binding NarL/FixJ family response regulator
VDDLASLVDKSLVARDFTDNRGARYRLLQSVRMFAAERLGSGGQADSVYRRHAEYYLRLSEQPDADLSVEEQNLRAAWRWADECEDMELTRQIATAVARQQDPSLHTGAGAVGCSKRSRTPGPLSERETAVLRLIAEGMRSKQIGSELYMAERTVKAHVTSILNKLGADTRSQALGLAVRDGLL